MLDYLQGLWHELTVPRATDPDEARREHMANVIILGVGCIGLVYTIVMSILYFAVPGLPREPLLGAAASLPLMPLCIWLSRRGLWRLVPVAPILALLGITIYGQWTFGPYNVAIVLYGALVIIALVAYGARGAVVAALASVASYALVGAVTLEREAPAVSMPVRIIVLSTSLAMIILLQWFFTSQLRQALVEARTYAAELRDSERRYRTLFDNVPVGLYRTTLDGQIVDANPAQAQMLAYADAAALYEMNASDLYVDARDRNRWMRQMERDGVVMEFEARFRRQDGEAIWVNDTARAVHDEEGNVLYFEGSIEDITQRKEAEAELKQYQEHLEELVEQRTAELRESERRYRTLFNGVPVGLYRSTPDGTVVDANEAVLTMLGLPSLESRPNTEASYVDPQTREHWKALMDQYGVVRDFECRMRRHDGTILWAKDSARVVTDEQGRILYYEGSLEDITERKRAEEELQQAKEAAEAANQAKSRFLANMSHELRTPLNAIIGFTRLVRRRGKEMLPQRELDNLEKVLVSADQLLGLINDVLDLSKIEAGRTQVKAVTFDVGELVDACLLTIQPLIKSDRLQLVKDIPPDLPQVHSDRDRIGQVLLNLLGNAVKFTDQGVITVSAVHHGDQLTLSVSDTGIGIAKDDLGRIFEAFQQVDTSTTRRHGGTGLGLTISRQLARVLGGEITVESEFGKGSTFSVTLPCLYRGADVAPDTAVISQETAEPVTEKGRARPLVLAIDDDPNVIDLLQQNLSDAGYDVVGVTSGVEGLQQAQSVRPSAIVLDILMSPKDGWQVLRELKHCELTRGIPVIVLSIVENRERGYRLGAADYLLKPFDRDAILSTLARVAPQAAERGVTHLLLVDDDTTVLQQVCQLLHDLPYSIRTASDGQQALQMIAEQRPDVILLDTLMPHVDGFALCQALREDQRYRDIPVILLAEDQPDPSEVDSLSECVQRIVEKQGLSREVLLEDLRSALEACRRTEGEP